MAKCWASCLGDCDGPMTGEHIVSKGLFESRLVTVRGFHWCKYEPKNIGLASLTKNILCARHNNGLSPLDAAASWVFDVLRRQTRLHNERSKFPRRRYKRVSYHVNARALERWLLKTLINITYGEALFIGPKSMEEGCPSDDLVEIVFGCRKFSPENGLFVAAKIGQTFDSRDRVHFSALMKGSKHLYGARFVLRGLHMFLDLVPGGLNVPFEDVPGMDPAWHGVGLMKPFRQIKVVLGNRIHQTIDFRWR